MLEFLVENWKWAIGILIGLLGVWATFYVARRDKAKSNRSKQSILGGDYNEQTANVKNGIEQNISNGSHNRQRAE